MFCPEGLVYSPSSRGMRRLLETEALATEADTSVRSCRGPDSRLNRARVVRATPAVTGSELSRGCSTNVWGHKWSVMIAR